MLNFHLQIFANTTAHITHNTDVHKNTSYPEHCWENPVLWSSPFDSASPVWNPRTTGSYNEICCCTSRPHKLTSTRPPTHSRHGLEPSPATVLSHACLSHALKSASPFSLSFTAHVLSYRLSLHKGISPVCL